MPHEHGGMPPGVDSHIEESLADRATIYGLDGLIICLEQQYRWVVLFGRLRQGRTKSRLRGPQ